MKRRIIFNKSLLAASILAITACSGSGGDTTSAATSSKSVVGVITGFGSIYVNGVEYETDTAGVHIDGLASDETSLAIGDIITLQGTVNPDGTTGVATAVTCNDELEGYVLDTSGLLIDGTGTINVMGQIVTITLDTVFDGDTLATINATINDLSVLDIVEISGFPDGTGGILATRVESKNAAEDVEVKGAISQLNTTSQTFKIGALLVDYSSASDVPADTLFVDGLFVEVKTTEVLTGDVANGFRLIASKVEFEDDDSDVEGDEGDELEVQGMVSNIDNTGFSFNGTRVEFASLEIGDDFNVASLVDGTMITVEGHIDTNGNFIIEEVEDEHESEDEAKGAVTAVTATTVTIVDTGVSITFSVNNDTRMLDKQDANNIVPLHYFSLTNVRVGDYLKMEYFIDGATNKVATELVRDDAPTT